MKLGRHGAIAESMSALVLGSEGVELERRPVPHPEKGQVLVRMHAAPINPNDLMVLDGTYEKKKALPVVPGLEGSGRVVAAGGGLMSRYLLGRRVACVAAEGDGTWAEYMCTDADKCAPLAAGTDFCQGSMLLTNPLTASVLFAHARREGGAFVQNAAAGSLGQMLVRLSKRAGMPAIHIVRRDEQAAALRSIGAEHVVVSGAPRFSEELRALCTRLGVRFGLDAVAGEATGQMLGALAGGGTVMVYGMLSGRPCEVDPDDLVFRGKRLLGFTMYDWVEQTSLLGQLRALRAAQRRLADDLRSEIRARVPLADHEKALSLARSKSSEGKVLLELAPQ